MSKIISLVLFQAIFCSTFFTLTYSANPLIESTCKKTPFYKLCITTLTNYPGSSTTDVAGLARIVADSLNAQAIATLNEISTLLKSATDPSLKKALSGCADSYNTILKADIPKAIESIKNGKPKFAVDSATNAANKAKSCGQNVGNSQLVTNAANKSVQNLSIVLKSIASLLL